MSKDTDTRFDLTRRSVLSSLGVVGVGAALGGAGTSAFFSDEETFENNTLVAGALDLQVDWQEHYFDGTGVDDLDWHYRDPGDSGYIPLPTLEAPMVWVHEDDLAAFMDATATEAYPDSDDDGIQDLILTRDQISSNNQTYTPEQVEQAFHDQFADVPQDLDRPVIDVDDVKPGDFGEVTFSTHLHNNPGYLWLVGDLIDASENGLTEPEENDPDEGEGVELLDVANAAIWYDDGDNIREAEEMVHSPHDVTSDSNVTVGSEQSLLAMGSLREVLESLSSGMGVPLDSDPTTGDRECYPNSTTYYFGFAWWLPVDHGNEVQTDSVTFDLGFYTEQCRHNDGSGMAEPRNLSTGKAEWQVDSSPDDTSGPAMVTDPHSAWATSSCASWVDPYANDAQASDAAGEYVYELDFEVEANSTVDTLVIEEYGSDNPVEFYLDGTKIGGTGGESAYSALRSDIDPVPNLDPGSHTLRAVVQNASGPGSNPSGLLVCARLE